MEACPEELVMHRAVSGSNLHTEPFALLINQRSELYSGADGEESAEPRYQQPCPAAANHLCCSAPLEMNVTSNMASPAVDIPCALSTEPAQRAGSPLECSRCCWCFLSGSRGGD